MTKIKALAAFALIWILPVAHAARSAAEDGARSFFILPTGNGYGFQLFDTRDSRLVAFQDHPYRYLRPQADIRKDGIERRNLLEQMQLGLAYPGQPTEWLEGTQGNVETEYLEQTNILRNARTLNDGASAEKLLFSPFGLKSNALIALIHTPRIANGEGIAQLRFHLGANPVSRVFYEPSLEVMKIPGESIQRWPSSRRPVWVVQGGGGGAMIYIPLQKHSMAKCELTGQGHLGAKDRYGDRDCKGDDLGLQVRSPLDREGWFGVMIAYVDDRSQLPGEIKKLLQWIDQRTSESLLTGNLAEWKAWRKPPPAGLHSEDESKLWRQNEAVLRMAQIREPNNFGLGHLHTSNGMLLASLAPGHWATGWVRDGTYSTVALARSGHLQEARASLDFFLHSNPVGKFKDYVGGYPYQISLTRYYGSGEEEADYSGEDTPNIETDGWGLVLWAARQYLDQSRDLPWLTQKGPDGRSNYEIMRQGIAEAIVSQLEDGELRGVMKPDSSIWEVHQEHARHFAFTSLTAVRGLCDFASIAARSGHTQDSERYKILAETARAAFLHHFATPEGYLVAALERTHESDLDGSVVEAFGLDVFRDFTSPLSRATLNHLDLLRLPSGGYMRVDGSSTYQTNEWAFIDYRMAGALRRSGNSKAADALIDMNTARARNNFYVLPELYVATPSEGAIGAYQGSNPMVGYGSGVMMLAILERAGLMEARSCDAQ